MSKSASHWAAAALLATMFLLAGGAALDESVTVDEFAHVGAGLSYWQRLDMRLNGEHPPLGKLLAALPLAIMGTHADYSSPAWRESRDYYFAYLSQFVFGDAVLGRWNDWRSTAMRARFPMLILTLLLGWVVYRYASRIGGPAGGLLCLAAFVTTPALLVFGPLVLTDVPVTLFSLIALWRLGEIWDAPSPRNAFLFGAAFAGSLLSKFTGVLLIAVVLALFLQTRRWPTAAEPADKLARKQWRGARWRAVWRGSLWAALMVYAVYFVFSWNQPPNALSLLGDGAWIWIVRRPLMPLWLFVRGFITMLATGSRPTFLLGHAYSHGVPYYFPVVFALKSTLGFLALLGIAAVAGRLASKGSVRPIPDAVRPHWRVLMVGFFVYLTVCLVSLLDMSIRHFLMPVVLLITMLAPLPRMVRTLPAPRLWQTAIAAAAAGSFVGAVLAYPYFLPYVNGLAFGHPVYQLVNDSNVSWNEALPEVERFARERHLGELALDWASLADPAQIVPQATPWDCQDPGNREGQWVAVAAVSILENHNCGYLQQYPHQVLGGGSFYVFQLPSAIPPAGQPGGPPLESERKITWGMPFDARPMAVDVERHPERLHAELQEFMDRMMAQARKGWNSGKK
jgi:4-amino-4-deoxy-L-arabinose transferase-like glycosyltransferase